MLSVCPDAKNSGAVPFEIFLALTLNFFVALAVWPGFMSWDSLFALKQLRQGITVSAYPPVVSYVWYLPDHLIPGPGGMLLLQNGILLGAVGLFLYSFRARILLSMGLLVLFVATPIILGPMLVVWKDIGMSAFLALAVALIVYASRKKSLTLLTFGFVSLVIGGCYRLNAFPALLPIGLAGLLVLREIRPEANWRRLMSIYAAGGVFAFLVIALSVSFRLPDLRPLPRVFNSNMTQIHGLLGMSVCLGENLVPPEFFLRPASMSDLERVYKPQHSQLSFTNGNPEFMQYTGFPRVSDLAARWRHAVISHPLCYLKQRLDVLAYLLGANKGAVFYPTHPLIDENDLGIKMQPTVLTQRLVGYIERAAQPAWGLPNALARGWFWGLLAAVCCLALYIRRRPAWPLAALIYTSGVLYLAGSFFVVPAADARYAHWYVVTCFLSVALAISDAVSLSLERRREPIFGALSQNPP
jgi:hypothetical protein